MIDMTKVLNDIVPEEDGPGDLHRRKMVVSAVNLDGTVDLVSSGVTIPSVNVLAGAQLTVASNVQVISERGELLVLGKVGAPVAPPTTKPYALVTFGTPTLTTAAVTTLGVSSAPVNDAGMWAGGLGVTIPAGQAGSYEIGVTLWYAAQTTGAGIRQARINVNGTEFLSETNTAVGVNNTRAGVSLVTRRVMAAGDVIVFVGLQSSGGNLALDTNSHAWVERKS